tara:strand:+ start:1055 stop:1363 length:309 start_codon:yes stop_codon:yes gene_type:complete
MKKNDPLYGPYSVDVSSVIHRDAEVTTIVNTKKFDSMLEDLDTAYDYEVGFVPAGFEHRPDLIANVFYGSPANWWLLMLVNGISDPFEGFNVRDRILIPKIK